MSNLPRNTILIGDALEHLRTLPDESIDTVITSPPYFQLRSYGMGNDEYGHEPTVDGWVEQLRLVCREIHRVLVPTGSLWLNVGDSYSRHDKYGAPPKSLLLGPERLAIALINDGWHLRNSAVWAKTNPMPTSVRDRLGCNWEHVYFFTKQAAYHFDLDAIRIPHRTTRPTAPTMRATSYLPTAWQAPLGHDHSGLARLKQRGLVGHPAGKNPGDVWHLATARYRGAHFATFPTSLIELPLRASCPPERCRRCRLPLTAAELGRLATKGCCPHDASQPERGVVLDPFFGAGTVGLAAQQHDVDWIGIELNPAFARLAEQRIAAARCSSDRSAA